MESATVDGLVLEELDAWVANASGPPALASDAVDAMMAVGSDDDVSSSSPPRLMLVLLAMTLLLVGVPLTAGAPTDFFGDVSAGVGVGSSPSVDVTVCWTTCVMV